MKTKNIAFACLTEKTNHMSRHKNLVTWINPDLSETIYSYDFFESASNIAANVLKNLGVTSEDVISIFLPRSPELVNFFFGILKVEAISCTLFSTLGVEGLEDRLIASKSRVIIIKKNSISKIQSIINKLEMLEYVLVVDIENHLNEKILSYPLLATVCTPVFTFPTFVDSKKKAFLQFTSGSTGKPKAAVHLHSSLNEMNRSFHEILQVSKEEVFWCTADPAWITGLVYGLIVPFLNQTKQIHFTGVFSSDKWMSILQNFKVNVWYTAPTALRLLMQEDEQEIRKYSFTLLRSIFSVGEPLNPEIFFWGKRVFSLEIYDTWFQTETGAILIANRPGMKILPGSMGKPRKNIEAVICNEKMEILPPNIQGNLCIKKGGDSMFAGYFHNDIAYQEKFESGLYKTGDLAYEDSCGYFWFVSRVDDVINTSGHLVGPFEVESALLEIIEFKDVAVIGVPDVLYYQKIVAYIVLADGVLWSNQLELKARIHVSNRVSTIAIPSEFRVIKSIPKNQSGKILRRVLRTLYEGQNPGDISTMEV